MVWTYVCYIIDKNDFYSFSFLKVQWQYLKNGVQNLVGNFLVHDMTVLALSKSLTHATRNYSKLKSPCIILKFTILQQINQINLFRLLQ